MIRISTKAKVLVEILSFIYYNIVANVLRDVRIRI